MNGACNSILFWPRPLGPWGGVKKSKYNLISITVSILKIFIPNFVLVGWLVGFVALRPKSTSMVIAGRSVHLTTLFPGQA